MTRPWWRHPALGILALLVVIAGFVNFGWGLAEPQWFGSQGFNLVHGLAMVGTGYLLFGWVFPFAVGRERPDTAQRVADVQASGEVRASGWCSARVGWISFRGPLLRVRVYPGGVVLQPLLMASRAIQASEIVAVEDVAPIGGWLGPASIRITHTAPDVHSGVRLHINRQGQLAMAIRALLPSAYS